MISFCSSIRGNSSFVKVWSWDCSNLVTSSVFSSNYYSLAICTTSAVTSSTKALDPSKAFMRVGINFFQTSTNVDILTSSHEVQMFLMASRMANPFQKVFNLLCLCHQLWQYKMYFLVKFEITPDPWATEWVLFASMKTSISLYISIRALGWPCASSIISNILKGNFF